MKKVFALLLAVGMLSFMACGGSKDKEKAEKAKADSIKLADSLKQVKVADSLKQVKIDDSIKAAQDTAKKADKKDEKKKDEKKK